MMKKEIYKVKRTENLESDQTKKIESDWIKRPDGVKKSILMLNEPKNQLQGADLAGKTRGNPGIKWG